MGAVFRAYDRLSGEEVALKRLTTPIDSLDFSSRGEGNSPLALANEFRLLASLRHPNIIAVRDYGFDADGLPFYTMELLDAPQTILAVGAALPAQGKIDLILQVLEALTYLHRRQILHRDIAPNNLLVTDGRLRVLDFGLSTMRDQRVTLAGTLPYLAPELLSDGQPSEASDLYAVGVIAYELLTGVNPFKSDTVTRLIENILRVTPDLEALEVDFPTRHLIGRLLAKNPAERARDAATLIADYYNAVGAPLPPQESAVREGFLQAARFVGREAELAQLTDALARTMLGFGDLWLIGGESGVGKSRLVDELRTAALVRGALVLRGQAISSGSALYQAWLAVLRELVLYSPPSDFEASVLKPFVPDLEALLDHAVSDPPELEPEKAQERLISTVEALFARLEMPALLLLEDIHWAGRGSLAILARLSAWAKRAPLLIIGTYREEERPDLPEQFPKAQRLSLARLSSEQMAALTESMIGTSGKTPQVLDLLQRETEGNALFMIEVLRELAQLSGRLDRIGVVTLPERLFSGGVQTVLRRRLARLPETARSLLNLAAISGRQLDLALLRALHSEHTNALPFEAWLDVCADHAVLEIVNDQWRFAHDQLRETLVVSLSAADRALLSRQVARQLETLYPNDPQQIGALAHHWANAGDLPREAHYKALAGMQAVRNYAYERAVPLLERALALADAVGFDTLHKAQLERTLGRAHLNITEREAHYQRALALLGQPLPPTKGLPRQLIGAFVRQFLVRRTLPPRLYRVRPSRAADVLEAAAIYQHLSGDYWNVQRLVAGAYAVMRALNLAETLPQPTPELARAYVGAAIGMGSVLGLHRMARFYARKALETAEKVDDLETLAYVLNGIALPASYRGDWSARDYLERSATFSQMIGDTDSLATTLMNAAIIAYFQGDMPASFRLFAQMEEQLGAVPRFTTMRHRATLYRAQAHSLLHDYERARSILLKNDLARDTEAFDEDSTWAAVLAAVATMHLQAGDWAAAAPFAERAAAQAKRAPSGREVILEAVLGMAAQTTGEAQALWLAAAEQQLTTFKRVARTRIMLRPEYLRLQGWYLWLKGDQQAAHTAWQRGIALAEKSGTRSWLLRLYETYATHGGGTPYLQKAAALRAAMSASA
jgi:tRNA A-37 threonylcarbamoyl transferase component Bud32